VNGRRDRKARLTSSLLTTIKVKMVRTAIHPGEHLAEELRELGISAAELSREIEVPVNRVTSIINGQQGITGDTALRLGHWFGTSAEFWLNLQKLYELRLAQREAGDRIGKLPRRASSKRKADRAPAQLRSRG
jgi:antitoxin HigA-1